MLGLPALLLSSTFTMPPAIGLLLLAALAWQLLGRRACRWLPGERYEWAVLAPLAATALVALGPEHRLSYTGSLVNDARPTTNTPR